MRTIESLSQAELRAIVREVTLILWKDTIPADSDGNPILGDDGLPTWEGPPSDNDVDVLRPDAEWDEPREYLRGLARWLGALYDLAPDRVVVLGADDAVVAKEQEANDAK